jgi:type II secretory pathway predicted ATPase ExeA
MNDEVFPGHDFAIPARKAVEMYEAYFHLLKRPFAATPDPSCFFAPEPIRELVDELVLRAESGQGICVLTAPAGTGKTLVCRRIAADLAGRLSPLFLANANFPTRRALLQSILFELGLRYSGLEEQELRLAVYAALKKLTAAGRGAVLIVDEAHLLNDRLLEELRLLASLAEEDQPLARVIFAGQPALEERLVSPALEALNQRIVCHAWLDALTREQSIAYVNFRIDWAGGDGSGTFTPKALERIALACNGLPRCLNQLCDHVLLLAYVQELPRVSEEAVDEALRDLKQLPLNWNTPLEADISGEDLEVNVANCDTHDVDDVDPLMGRTHVASRTPSGEKACIEVGGPIETDDSTDDAEALADYSYLLPSSQARPAASAPAVPMSRLLAQHRREGVPAADPLPIDTLGFAEEPVADKYAALDHRLPRFSRTFEDAAVPESWIPPRQAAAPAAPRPGVASASTDHESDPDELVIDELRPDKTIDRMLPWLDAACETDLNAFVKVGEAISGSSADGITSPSPVAISRPEREPMEGQLGADVLDACLEVQAAVGHWREPGTGSVTTVDAASARLAALEGEIVAGSMADYDVIEPEAPALSSRGSGASGDEPASAGRTARYIPKPKYRLVFSTLRRRLGSGNGRRG